MKGSLDGFEVVEKPSPRAERGRTPMGDVIEAFKETGNECMGKRYPSAAELNRDRLKARYYIRSRNVSGVRVTKAGDMLLLVREGLT